MNLQNHIYFLASSLGPDWRAESLQGGWGGGSGRPPCSQPRRGRRAAQPPRDLRARRLLRDAGPPANRKPRIARRIAIERALACGAAAGAAAGAQKRDERSRGAAECHATPRATRVPHEGSATPFRFGSVFGFRVFRSLFPLCPTTRRYAVGGRVYNNMNDEMMSSTGERFYYNRQRIGTSFLRVLARLGLGEALLQRRDDLVDVRALLVGRRNTHVPRDAGSAS